MIDLARLQADVAQAVGDLPGHIIYDGQTIPVSLSPVNKSDDVADEGILNESEIEAVGVITDFATMPRVRDTVYLVEHPGAEQQQYFVERITRDESAVHLFLQVERW